MKRLRTILAMPVFLAACTDGGNVTPQRLSAGLKIFVTTEKHVGDFAGDPTLAGAGAMQKADAFCNRSMARPNQANYKALLVDGVTRDAIGMTNWVLRPNTTYYRPYNDVIIDTTSGSAIFNAYYSSLQNSIGECAAGCDGISGPLVWTGIDDPANFAADDTTNCGRWGDVGSTTGQYGRTGIYNARDGWAFSTNGSHSCDPTSGFQLRLYCVEQPS